MENKKQIKDKFVKALPFIVYSILVIVINLKMSMVGDDVYFSGVLQGNNLFNWIFERYNTWSSRILIEGIMVTLLNIGFNFWKVLNIGVFIILPYAIRKIFNSKNDTKIDWLICMSLFLIPSSCYGDAGWVATSMNYLWPLAFGLLACIPIKKNFSDEKMTKWEIAISCISLIIACNQEQMAGILAITYIGTLCYNLIKKKSNKIIIFYAILILANLLFIFTCPGNSKRKVSEIQTWFPEFATFNIIDKAQLAINSMMRYIVIKGRIVFMVMTAVIMYAVFITNKSKIFRTIAVVQFIGSIPLNIVNKFIPQGLFAVKDTINQFGLEKLVIDSNTYSNVLLYLMLLYYVIILGCIIVSLYGIFKNTNKSIISISILMLGLVSRLVMGLSPTVFASAERTTIFLYTAFIILIVYIINYLKENQKNIIPIYYGTIAASLVSYIRNVMSIF